MDVVLSDSWSVARSSPSISTLPPAEVTRSAPVPPASITPYTRTPVAEVSSIAGVGEATASAAAAVGIVPSELRALTSMSELVPVLFSTSFPVACKSAPRVTSVPVESGPRPPTVRLLPVNSTLAERPVQMTWPVPLKLAPPSSVPTTCTSVPTNRSRPLSSLTASWVPVGTVTEPLVV